ncbi:hypothetical protein [Streptomyces sp. R35]|uniref:Uncharacterized protein n=1 Tax=Streptomyces sp. R35 TaxID=3238630 RepID=A0AB39SBK1_9ACTN
MTENEFPQALQTVLQDLRAQSSVQPEIREHEEYGPVLWAPDGSGQGVSLGPGDSPAERLAGLADQVQDWAVEALWTEGEPAVWPCCPRHPDSHPLSATVVAGVPVWVCPKGGQPVANIGELPPRDAGK